MQREFHVLVERDEDGYLVASMPSLRGCHTQGKSMDEVLERIKEAIELCLEEGADAEASEFVGIQKVTVTV